MYLIYVESHWCQIYRRETDDLLYCSLNKDLCTICRSAQFESWSLGSAIDFDLNLVSDEVQTSHSPKRMVMADVLHLVWEKAAEVDPRAASLEVCQLEPGYEFDAHSRGITAQL